MLCRIASSRLWQNRLSSSKLINGKYLHASSVLSSDNGQKEPVNDKKIKDNVEVAVIGGGCIGTSIAYHLAKQGMKDVVLLEKSELTAGSTWHAAGLTTAFHPGINTKHIHWYSLNLYSMLEKETGQEVGMHRPGSIRLLSTPGRVKEAEYMISRNWGGTTPLWMMNPDEVHETAPFMNMDGILGGLWTPGDGHTDPYSLTQALAVGARMYGAQIYLSCPATSLQQAEDGSWDVGTPHGNIRAKRIINAGGFWAREIGKLAGADHPVIPIHHQYLVTTSIPEVQKLKKEMPVFRDLEGSYYIRQERDGLLIGPYEKGEKMKMEDNWWDMVTPGFGKELFENDLDRIMDHIEIAMERFPCVKDADIQSIIAGPITYTPDILPMAGPDPELMNYWVAIGFGYGVAHAGGIGKYLADWIQNGEPTFELSEFDPGRYGKWTTKDYVFAKARESYGFNNLQGYPKEERYAGRPMRTSPLYETLKKAGAQFTFSSGWESPKWYAREGEGGYQPSYYRTNWFEPVGREVRNTLENVSIADITPFAKFHIKGKDAKAFMDYMVANNLPKVGLTNVSHMLSPKGKVYAEVTISALADDHFFVITGGGSEYHDLRWLRQHVGKFEDVEITNTTDDVTAIALSGPKSRALLQTLTDTDMSNKGFKFMHNKQMAVAGIPVHALRVSYTGELGWELYVDNSRAVELYEAIMAAGQEFNIGHIGGYAINSMRIEKGFRLWGSEMNMDTNPYAAGLDFFIKLNKGDFIGRETLLKERLEVPNKSLVCMFVDTDNVDAEGDESIWYGDKIVGNTTSGCYAYDVQKSVAYAYVPHYLKDPGNEFYIDLMGKKYKSVIVPEPLVMMEAARVRAAAAAKKKMAAK